ncbi:ribosomal protein S18 acetylase RimI-like enzyme [Paraburkholderia graminis]|jgi:ribosomal protein S18 acetylase RimI-like enzyme|uniref:Ribosomal protein S18 acetylase RimI-like enzyme n=2 Tax=Burkholderiaceae TaxID=119060 RepID=A0ABD5CIZ6_9BURK|nr:ribosomal protein S18 acetylase RimI-like enzyme [Paraburkholderia graminis]MDR6205194.1 ribosomal protein S18 acetylase RimI-like enzyme [Paraburkholderia graminis]
MVKTRWQHDNSRPFLLTARAPARLDMSDHQPAITLRPASADDETFLFELRKATMTEHLARVGEPADDAEHRARLLHRYDAARVICVDGTPAGLLKAHRSDTEWRVVQLQIAPALQGRGIGERALHTVLRDADAATLPVTLKVLKGNPARRLYERLGFEVVSEDEREFHMRRAPRASAETEAE